jgi:hypothetical protein
MSKYREFWIGPDDSGDEVIGYILGVERRPVWASKPVREGYNSIHVIEKSAYDKAIAALKFIHWMRDPASQGEDALIEFEMKAEQTLKELGEIE